MKKSLSLILSVLFLMLSVLGSTLAEDTPVCDLNLNGETESISGIEFPGDVNISGNAGKIWFDNCVFHGNICLNAEETTCVCFLPSCTFDESTQCILNNPVTEGTIDYSVPKFMFLGEVRPVLGDGICGVICVSSPLQPVVLNGVAYTKDDIKYTADESGVIEYSGQEISALVICRWFENGQEMIFTYGE